MPRGFTETRTLMRKDAEITLPLSFPLRKTARIILSTPQQTRERLTKCTETGNSNLRMDPLVTQSDINGDDSSGSDGVSLYSVSLPATETDRFGFLLGTESTVGSEGPPPEVVRQREAKWLNIISQWDRILLKKTNKVKEQCRKGIPASLRARCWPLLCRATERMKVNQDLYQKLNGTPALQSWVEVIERDIDRQFPFHEMFLSRDGHGQQGLLRVLKTYTQFKPDEGYCQGQGPVAAVLLMNMPAEEAFWCLVQISEQYLPGYYSPLLEGVLFDADILNGVLRKVCPSAHKHLKKHGVEPLMFATDWLMCLYTRHLPFNTLLRVWDLFFCYGVRVLFQVAAVLVRRSLGKQEQRDECEGQMETLERLRSIKDRISTEDDAFIEEVCSVPFSGKDLERETEKEMEKWKKERPSSTFNPSLRCHGYRVAWIKGRERDEECQRRECEKGNLSVPLLRSPSSLSPSFLRKKWRRGSKVEMTEKERNGGREEYRIKAGPFQRTDMQKEEEGHASNDGNRRKPSETSNEGAMPNQKRTGQESTQASGYSSSENLESHSATVDLPHPHATCSNSETLSIEYTEGQARVSHPVAPLQTPQGLTEDRTAQPISTETGLVLSETANSASSEDQGTPQKPPCDKNREAAEETKKLSQERGQSEPSEGVGATSSECCQELETENGGKPSKEADIRLTGEETQNQGARTEECSAMQDDCTQRIIQEQSRQLENSSRNSPKLNETQQKNELCSPEEIAEDIAENPEVTDELSSAENSEEVNSSDIPAHYCQTFQEIQESDISSISSVGKGELSVKIHSNQEASSEINPVSSGANTDTISQQPECDGDTPKEPVVSPSEQEEANADVIQTESPSEQDHSQSQEEGAADCKLGAGKSLEENPGQSSEVDTNSSQCQDTKSLSDSWLSPDAKQQASESTITIADHEEQTLRSSFHSEADTPHVQSKHPENSVTAIPLAEGTVTRADENREEMSQQPNQVTSHSTQPLSGQLCSPEDEAVGDTHVNKVEAPALTPPELQPSHTTTHQNVELEKPTETTSGSGWELPNDQGPSVEKSAGSQPTGAESGSRGQRRATETDGDAEEQTNVQEEIKMDEELSVPELQDTSCKTDSSNPRETLESHDKPSSQTSTDSAMIKAHPDIVSEPIKASPTLGDQKSSGMGEFKLRKTSSSRTTQPRRLSEDTFKDPQSIRGISSPCTVTAPIASTSSTASTVDTSIMAAVQDPGKVQDADGHITAHKDSSRRFGLFRRLRGDTATNTEADVKSKTKMTVPTILIQDFSEQVGEPEERLTSKERRKRRREEERRKKEEEKARKKKEKELEKERDKERRKPQTRGKSFQVHSSNKTESVVSPVGNTSNTPVSKRNSAPYFDTYF